MKTLPDTLHDIADRFAASPWEKAKPSDVAAMRTAAKTVRRQEKELNKWRNAPRVIKIIVGEGVPVPHLGKCS